jgi:hypothetical protein
VTVRIVPSLEVDPPLQRLHVGDPGLGVDSRAPRRGILSPNLRIPCAEVALDSKRHLGSPSKARVEPGSKPLQEGTLRAVADRITPGIGADREVQPHDGTPRSELGDRHTIEISPLEAQELLMRCGGRRAGLPKAQARADAREAMILPEAPQGFTGASASSIGWSLSSTHCRHDPTRDFTVASPAVGPAAGPTSQRAAGRRAIRAVRPLSGPAAGPCSKRRGWFRPRPAHWAGPIARWSASRTRRPASLLGAGSAT